MGCTNETEGVTTFPYNFLQTARPHPEVRRPSARCERQLCGGGYGDHELAHGRECNALKHEGLQYAYRA